MVSHWRIGLGTVLQHYGTWAHAEGFRKARELSRHESSQRAQLGRSENVPVDLLANYFCPKGGQPWGAAIAARKNGDSELREIDDCQ